MVSIRSGNSIHHPARMEMETWLVKTRRQLAYHSVALTATRTCCVLEDYVKGLKLKLPTKTFCTPSGVSRRQPPRVIN